VTRPAMPLASDSQSSASCDEAAAGPLTAADVGNALAKWRARGAHWEGSRLQELCNDVAADARVQALALQQRRSSLEAAARAAHVHVGASGDARPAIALGAPGEGVAGAEAGDATQMQQGARVGLTNDEIDAA
jgi:hypothetical protein